MGVEGKYFLTFTSKVPVTVLDFFCFFATFSPQYLQQSSVQGNINHKQVVPRADGRAGNMVVNVNVGDGDRDILLLDVDAEYHLLKGGTTGRWACWQPG